MNEISLSNDLKQIENEQILSNYLIARDFESLDEIKIFNSVIITCNPRYSSDTFESVFEIFFKDINKPKPVFSNTIHENIFAYLFPNLEKQVVFGLGKGSYKRFGVKKYTADFLDRDTKTIWEIDGKSHEDPLQKLKDKKRDLIMQIYFGIETVRVTNEHVERLLLERIRRTKVVERWKTKVCQKN